MSFTASGLGFAYGLHEASFEFPQNGLITIAGPNGAAARLGIKRPTLQFRMQKLGISRPQRHEPKGSC